MDYSSQPQKNSYDVVVIGAGPAGLIACRQLLAGPQKPSVLLLDKVVPWENPKPCAEAVGRLGLLGIFGQIDPAWIRFEITKAAFHAPDSATITYADKNRGYIINRSRMQHDCALQTRKSGVECCFKNKVAQVALPQNGLRHVTLDNGLSVAARVVIDASGSISLFGKNESIAWKSDDLEPTCFAVVNNVDCALDTVNIYVGRDIAPGGYAWVFPREAGTANIGVVVGRKLGDKAPISKLLQQFLKRNFAHGTVQSVLAGTIACGYVRRPRAVNGLFRAGDAAGTVNPISRAGIVEAMVSGRIAGDYALAYLGAPSQKKAHAICKEYERAWFENRGRRHAKLARAKAELRNIPDTAYNKGAAALLKIPQDELTMSKIFGLTLSASPRLVWALRHLM